MIAPATRKIPALRLKENLSRVIDHPCCTPYRFTIDEGHKTSEVIVYCHRIVHTNKGIKAFGKREAHTWLKSDGPRVTYHRMYTGRKERGIMVTFIPENELTGDDVFPILGSQNQEQKS